MGLRRRPSKRHAVVTVTAFVWLSSFQSATTVSHRHHHGIVVAAFSQPSVCRMSQRQFQSQPHQSQPHHQRHHVTAPLWAFPEWQDDTADEDFDLISLDTAAITPSPFYDIDYADDDSIGIAEEEEEEEEEDDDKLSLLNPYRRDEDEMLMEKEDRFYQDPRQRKETCVLVGVEAVSRLRNMEELEFSLEESMNEMKELIKTAGMELVGEITQRLQQVNPKTYIGTGKVMEAQELLQQHDCNTLVFDAELTPGQQKALENALNRNLLQNDFLGNDREIKVIDRTALILDIFAQHAKTREGKLQVDLALHEYRKPRLTKLWTHLERQSASGSGGMGVVGLRGPGESQLEMDKRLLRDRILVLKEKINQVQKQRELHRRGRRRTGLPILSLVGYTNAGKSTLLNTLTQAGVMAESMLFATLDPTTRKVQLPTNTDVTSAASLGAASSGNLMKTRPEVLLTDTVGFIQKLPTHLVAAFRATLEEVQYADVLLHVIDVSNPTWPKQEQAVLSVLRDIGCANKPMIRILNKIDLLPPYEASFLCQTAAESSVMPYHQQYHNQQQPFYTVAVSAFRGDGMNDFVAVIEEALSDMLVPIEVEIPYQKGEDLNMIHEQGNVETVDYRVGGTYVVARVPRSVANRVQQYSVVVEDEPPMMTLSLSQLPGASAKVAMNPRPDEEDWTAIGRGRHTAKRR